MAVARLHRQTEPHIGIAVPVVITAIIHIYAVVVSAKIERERIDVVIIALRDACSIFCPRRRGASRRLGNLREVELRIGYGHLVHRQAVQRRLDQRFLIVAIEFSDADSR